MIRTSTASPAAPAGALDPQGPAARSIADLWWLMVALGAAVFVAVAVLLVVGLFRRRADPDEPAPARPPIDDAADASPRRWLVGGGVVLPVVVLTVVLAATVATLRDVESSPPPDALVVEVVGHQYWWEVRYPDLGVVTANEIHLPLDRPVAFELTSADVIHSFWVPALGGKLDALPDGVNTLVLEADEPGVHRSECAEFCGIQHTHMAVIVTAEPQSAFDGWIEAQRRSAAEPASDAARRGRAIVLGDACAGCHAIRGTSADGATGPDLTHVRSRPTLGAGAADMTTPDLHDWVTDPHTAKDGVLMPAPDLTDDEIDAVVAYLETLE